MNGKPETIGIIGGGCSGVLLAAHLARYAGAEMTVYIIERSQDVARGAAYATTHWQHLLNAPVGRMSGFEDDPEHFLRWLRRTSAPCEPWRDCDFAPRKRYGDYLESLLLDVMRQSRSGPQVELIFGAAVAIEGEPDALEIVLADGRRLPVDKAVLCTGFAGLRTEPAREAAWRAKSRVIANPWADGDRRRIKRDDSVLILGTGLTMIDVVLELEARGHRGSIRAISRRGLLPQPHAPLGACIASCATTELPGTVLDLLALARIEIDRAAARGLPWQSAMEALRQRGQDFWRALPTVERRRFLRHLQPFWNTHRHRMAPELAERFLTLRAAGRVSVTAGRIVDVTGTEPLRVAVKPRGSDAVATFDADWIVDCTGPDAGRDREDALFAQLHRDGAARKDALGLGFAVECDGAVIAADGQRSDAIFAIGAPTRGALWDITAVPEIRRQCDAVARALCRSSRTLPFGLDNGGVGQLTRSAPRDGAPTLWRDLAARWT